MNIAIIDHYINEVFTYTLAGFLVECSQSDTCVVESAKQINKVKEKP